MSGEVFEKFDVEAYDSKNKLRITLSFDNKDEAIESFKGFKLLYKDGYIVSLTHIKTYVQDPFEK